LEYEGAVYHVLSRGDRREPIFHGRTDRLLFLETLADACLKTEWRIHAYCLMDNHFHLVAETPKPNLIAGMKWLLGTYTIRFNRRHQLSGHLFGGRYKAIVVDHQTPGYFKTVCDYVHLNPVRAHLLGDKQSLAAYPWSSFPEYMKPETKRVAWICVDRLLGEFGCVDDPRGRKIYARHLEMRRGAGVDEAWAELRRGWFFGDDRIKRELMSQRSSLARKNHTGHERRECTIDKAQRIIDEELTRQALARSILKQLRKGDPVKVAIAQRLRRETTVTLAWIANQLHMGTWTYVSNLLASVNSED
jgi:REP element-mobilizing transposase RayT